MSQRLFGSSLLRTICLIHEDFGNQVPDECLKRFNTTQRVAELEQLCLKERDYSVFVVLRNRCETLLYRVQVSAGHERGLKLSDTH